jgi:undecaprenyl-diphosphatase
MPFDLQTINDWLSSNPHWLGTALFLSAFIECLAVAGLIIPGTVLLFAVSVLAGNGVLSLSETLFLAFAGGLLGDIVSYALGRRYQDGIRRLPILRRHSHWLERAEDHLQRYGMISLLVGRFIGPLRPMLPMIAGMLNMPLFRFLLVSLFASAGWAMAYTLPGWSTGAALRLPLPPGFWPELASVAGAVALLLLFGIQQTLTGGRKTLPIMAGLCFVFFFALFFSLPHLKELDEGLMAVLQEARAPEWDRALAFVTGLGNFDAQLLAGVLICVLLATMRQWRVLWFVTGSMLGTACANGILKNLFARTRPEVLLEPLHTYSFPSGHSSATFALCLTLGVLAGRGQPPRLRLTWLLLGSLPAVAVAGSRIYLGAHWPTDIVAGALLAGFFCAMALLASERRSALLPLSSRHWMVMLPAVVLLLLAFAIWVFPASLTLYHYQ